MSTSCHKITGRVLVLVLVGSKGLSRVIRRESPFASLGVNLMP
jgi:hypothetical protein